MPSRYRRLLALPGARRFALAGLLSRMPISTVNISVIVMIEMQYESWEMAGRVAAVGVLVWAAQTLPTARWIDRKGQRMMIPLVALFVIGVVILVATAMSHGPEPALWLGMAVASVSGPLGSLTRARWSHLLSDPDDIHSAFSLEGALDEVLFVAGPALAAYLAAQVHPASGLVIAAIGMTVGVALLLADPSTEPPRRADGDAPALGWSVPAAVLATAVSGAMLGVMFGAFDITTIALADESGHEGKGGLVIAVISFGSFLGGIAYGARVWRMQLWLRQLVVACALSLGFVAMGLTPSIVTFSAVGFLAGLWIGPTLTSMDSIIQRVVPQAQLTEGLAWLRIGMGGGVAAGGWLAGRFIDHGGAGAGQTVLAIAAAALGVAAIAGTPWIRRDTFAADAAAEHPVQDAPAHDA